MILNLTQHKATTAQISGGLHDVPESWQHNLNLLLTFDVFPTQEHIRERARAITEMARDWYGKNPTDGAKCVMIGGAPWLMAELEKSLRYFDFTPCYAFSKREVIETETRNGNVIKRTIFRHLGFIRAA